MNSEIKDLVSKCDTCRTYEPSQQKETLISHETPNRPWSVVGVDLFQSPVSNDQYLITVDYFSNFFEIDRLETTSSAAVINKLKQHFARHGIPDKVISDNGPQFSSQQFSKFKHMWEFDHRTSSPAYPQSNGKAENAVKSAKQLMRKAKHSGQDPWLAVLDFRNTPSQGIGESPCQRLMNRRTKTLMPVKESLLSSVGDRANIKNMRKEKDRQAHYYNRTAKDLRELQPGDTVRMKPTQLRDKEWKKGTIIGREGSRSYNVQTQDGTYRRNRSHLKDTREERNDFTVFREYTSPSIEDLPENDRKPAIDETADLEQNANDQPMVITSSEVTTNRESAPTTRYGRVVKPPRYLENYVQAVYNV
jgi:transposase InsO family protein